MMSGVDGQERCCAGRNHRRRWSPPSPQAPPWCCATKVAVRLREAGIAQRAHHARTGERLDRNNVSGCFFVTAAITSCETHRYAGCPAEDRHAGPIHQVHDAFGFRFDAFHVGVEIDRIDVLDLLRRILGRCDRFVRPVAEPVRMLLDPRVVRRALQREVRSATSSPSSCACAQNALKSSMVPSGGIRRCRSMTPEPMPDRSGSCGPAIKRVICGPYGWSRQSEEDRRQVDVEAFGAARSAGQRRPACPAILRRRQIRAFGRQGRTGTMRRRLDRSAGSAADSALRPSRSGIGFMQARLRRWSLRTRDRVERLNRQQSSRLRTLLPLSSAVSLESRAPVTFQQLRRIQRVLRSSPTSTLIARRAAEAISSSLRHDVPFAELLINQHSHLSAESLWSHDLDHRFPSGQAGVEQNLWGSGRPRCRACCAADTVAPALMRPSMNTCAVTFRYSPAPQSRAQAVPGGRVMPRTFTQPGYFGTGAVDRCWSFATVRFVAVFGLSALGGWFLVVVCG